MALKSKQLTIKNYNKGVTIQDDVVPVLGKRFNELQEDVSAIADGSGITADSIAEKTSGAGVTIDGVKLQDNGISLLTGGISMTPNVKQYTTLVTLTADEIVGTDAGNLGHSGGAVLVAAPGAGYTLQFVNAVLIYDYDTAAYTGGTGDDLVIRQGTTSVTSAIADADLILASADKIVNVNALSAADLALTENSTLNLKSTAITQPGTAAGVIRVYLTYNVITTGL